MRSENNPIERKVALSAAGLLLILCAAASASPAAAQGYGGPSAGNYGVHLAYIKADDAEDGNMLVGGHLELRLAQALGIQGAVAYRSTESFAVSTIDPDGLQIKSVPVTVTGRIYLPNQTRLSPFLLAGGGWYHVIYDYSELVENTLDIEDQSTNTFGWHLGVGATLGLSEALSLSGEGRYVFIDPDRDLGEEARDEIGKLDYDTLYLGAGLNFRF